MTSAGCQATVTALDADEALCIIEPYYLAMQDVFIEAGLDRVKRTRLYVAPWLHDTPRHFAACQSDGRTIIVAPELCEQDERIVLAVLAHELGHASDFLYPGEFVLGKQRKLTVRQRSDFEPKQWARWIKSWEGRDDDAVEFTADAVAEYATGERIGYVGPCLVQCFNLGRARPQGLR